MSNHLTDIVSRQRTSRSRDFLFAAFVALAAVLSVATLGTAIDAATQIASR